jgi:hypothetical protein
MPDDLLGLAPDDTFTPQYDAGSLAESADAIRRSINVSDPRSLYFNKPELAKSALAAAEAKIAAAYARSGIAEPRPATPEEQHRAQFRMLEMNGNLKAALDDRLASLAERNTTDRLQQMGAELRNELGAETYDLMVSQAKHAVEGVLPPAVLADRLLLRTLAAQGKYTLAYEQTKPRK